jgi:tRNA(adenine34) deaminase
MTDLTLYEQIMRRCIELGRIAKQRGESPVGAVIVKDDQVIAEGIESGKTHKDITCHAEIEAIRNAIVTSGKTDLSDCFMVTTHEPCIMCSYVIRHHKIKLVVFGLATGEIGGYSSGFPVLSTSAISIWGAPPKIIEKVLEQECRNLHV